MPKRSAGCFECRKRKVRCDEARPECNTCTRRGKQCPGYRPTQSFVIHKFDEQNEKPAIIREDENRYRFAQQQKTNNNVVRFQTEHARPVDQPVLTRVSPIAIERVQYVGTFISLYLPKAEIQALPPPSALILSLPSIPASETLLAAVDALAAAQLAVANRNYTLINRSRSLYSTALSRMLLAVQSPTQQLEDETLLATYLLTLYEVFVGITQGHGFFYHVQGLLHLIKLRGPESFKTRLSMQIFHAIRYNSLSIGYHLRKASMLDSPAWLAVTEKSAKLDPYVALQDICICIPRILERTDKLANETDFQQSLDLLINDASKLAQRGFDWFASFEQGTPRYHNVDITQIEGFDDIIQGDRTFDPVFYFDTFGAGICYMIYWMSMLILQSNTFRLLRQHRKLEPKELFLWDRELSSYANSICRSVPFNCRPMTGSTARFGSLTPLVVARKYFEAKKAEKEQSWCEHVYQGARVPGLYSTPIPMEPLQGLQRLVQSSGRYL
ncbi:unnamed protein product [Periconia digitata]|uniref:Zn(2)-C6 fungal-type domain-containing protein n=1 Tax=Periconia digitata TaxID=1303443 RepID=A0A9W4UJM3_9PLEO|nr:unnamed protein product [Periconia digitata]